jgi:hypothetical protein
MSENALVMYQGGAVMPVIEVKVAMQRYQDQKDFIESIMHDKVDYGIIPGTEKNTLLKPGAEKLCWFFGLRPVFRDIEHVEDWTGATHGEPFFYYRVQCELMSHGEIMAAADGSANSWEKKHRYRWVNEADIPPHLDKSKLKTRGGRTSEFTFAVNKAETSGQYGKPVEYWKRFTDAINSGNATPVKRKTKSGNEMDAWEIDTTLYCIPNEEVADLVNTILKMAQKRALVAATLIGANASEWFTQDMEDFIDSTFVDVTPTTVAPPPATAKKPEPVKATEPPMPEGETDMYGAPMGDPLAPKTWTSTVVTWEQAQAAQSSDKTPIPYLTMPLGDLQTRQQSLRRIVTQGYVTKAGVQYPLNDDERANKTRKLAEIDAIVEWRMPF